MSASSPTRILLVEDNELLRDNYFRLINSTPGLVCVAGLADGLGLPAFISAMKPDVILMDINMPGKNGIEAVREIREAGIETPIVMQTIFDDDDKVFQSILAGANGYILKSTTEERLIEAIIEATHGGAPMTPNIAAKVVKFLRERPPQSGTKRGIPGENELNERQKEVLELLMEGASYKMIADELNISMDTVRYHLKNIYRILHINSRTELNKYR